MVATLGRSYPFRGRWLTRNSPADRVPSRGADLFATALRDRLRLVDAGRSARMTRPLLAAPRTAGALHGLRARGLAAVDGAVVAAHDGEADHHAFRGLPAVGYALTQRGRGGRRDGCSWPATT